MSQKKSHRECQFEIVYQGLLTSSMCEISHKLQLSSYFGVFVSRNGHFSCSYMDCHLRLQVVLDLIFNKTAHVSDHMKLFDCADSYTDSTFVMDASSVARKETHFPLALSASAFIFFTLQTLKMLFFFPLFCFLSTYERSLDGLLAQCRYFFLQ